ncbi:hypothetical protein LCGC14_2296030, partial [marine sediment metagenome]
MGKLKQAVGKWVCGDEFWDREADVELFIERVEAGGHLLLVAQRRMGKTSLMREVARRLQDSYICLFVDLQKAKGGPDAVVELGLAVHPHKSLWQKARGALGSACTKALDRIEKIGGDEIAVTLRAGVTAGDWASKADRLLATIAAAGTPVLLLLDEVPIMVNRLLRGRDGAVTAEGKRLADEFLSWLRQNSIRHQGTIRMVLSGSIGLEPVLHQAGLSATINTFEPFELRPWDESVARGCLQALANQYNLELDEEVAVEMVDRLGCCIPHHVQLFFAQLRYRCVRAGRDRPVLADVEAAYEEDMLGSRGHAELTHYEERLRLVLGAEEFPLALEMLTEASVTGRLTREALEALQGRYALGEEPASEAEKRILWILEHDGYLRPDEEGYAFVSTLLRDWWRRRHGSNYT